jgi:hypothetical protein
MKKTILPIAIALVTFGLFSFKNNAPSGFQAAPFNANGPSGGQAGAPGEQNCSSCHSGATQNGANENLLVVNNDIGFGITQYTPGASYAVNLSMASNPAKKGFQVTALNAANTMAGNFVAGANTQIKTATISGGQRKYATHKSSSNTSATQTWNWTWEAPATEQGAITFYVATNKANNNGNDNGDIIYLSQHVFLNDDVSIEELQVETNFNAGYSIDKNAVYIEYSTLSIATTSLNVVDLNGKSVFSKKLGASTIGANKTFVGLPTGLPEGFYVVHFFVGNQAFSKSISVQH